MRFDLKFRTDLALEAADTNDEQLPNGVAVTQQNEEEIIKTCVSIQTDAASERLGRPKGDYITLEGPFSSVEKLITLLSESLAKILPKGACLVVGLGNRQITPDTLGSEVADKIIATGHIPKAQRKALGLGAMRDVCVLAPGAMGQTGIETAEIVSMVSHGKKFASVICVDALAARSMGRLGNTIQLSDAGISPGSGVHNSRSEISQQKLGVPVISIGVPTVVDVATLVGDLCAQPPEKETADMIVTPRGIDEISQKAAVIIATAINLALQNEMEPEVVRELMT